MEVKININVFWNIISKIINGWDKMELRHELKGYIASAGMTSAALAEKLGISPPALSQKINNESLRYKDAVKIADLLGYDIVWKRRD